MWCKLQHSKACLTYIYVWTSVLYLAEYIHVPVKATFLWRLIRVSNLSEMHVQKRDYQCMWMGQDNIQNLLGVHESQPSCNEIGGESKW